MKVLYYYYYLFYKSVLKEDDPHFTTKLALSASESFLINGIIDFIALKFYCYKIDKWYMIGVLVVLLAINFLHLYTFDKVRDIILNPPSFFDNPRLSKILVIVFFVFTASWLFWGPIYGKYMLEHCR